jgi:hypothetical protein
MTLDEILREMRKEYFPEIGRRDCAPTATGIEQYIRAAYEAGKRDGARQAAGRSTRPCDAWEDDG